MQLLLKCNFWLRINENKIGIYHRFSSSFHRITETFGFSTNLWKKLILSLWFACKISVILFSWIFLMATFPPEMSQMCRLLTSIMDSYRVVSGRKCCLFLFILTLASIISQAKSRPHTFDNLRSTKSVFSQSNVSGMTALYNEAIPVS